VRKQRRFALAEAAVEVILNTGAANQGRARLLRGRELLRAIRTWGRRTQVEIGRNGEGAGDATANSSGTVFCNPIARRVLSQPETESAKTTSAEACKVRLNDI